ncbi:pterin-4-alpha-carbinolamine dehydratase [Croceibacterium mercuriale]|uniref:Putative pterin-4-alpha-carbinolamine dehydratase n=1 Tax=Croceibacterium mercuriale TaxID=1572751 RepID=A0A0B2BZK1_9SPHN|nr:pterin-4-alpha-carbinolamine dehydratase [Croceibacterium mercuriale]
MIAPLTPEQRIAALHAMPHWTYDPDRRAFYRALRLADFAEAIGLMMRIAVVAEKADHHPEWFNVYNRLEIWLTTHDAGDVSQRDIDLAQAIDGFVPIDRHG